MGRRNEPAVAPLSLAKRVRVLIFRDGVAGTRALLGDGISREALCCIAGRLPTSPGAIAIAARALEGLR